ncbi:virulence factor family protein [Methylomonas sp. 11b]|uniref:virulence factor family protein n=1 Tax=Methylomonas sp. 11b TaxID=1168169 RepID=UPI0005627D4C|nr:AcvB/VirJ family lysyl-phosphatidylglycerol hydrolase [Methylomonas sp. 11b]
MKIKRVLLVFLTLGLMPAGVWLSVQKSPLLVEKQLTTEGFGDINVAEPLWNSHGMGIVFVDSQKYPPRALAQRLAATGVTAAVIDTATIFKRFHIENKECLDSHFIATSINGLIKQLPRPAINRLIVAGVAEAALLPFLNAQDPIGNETINLSIGFSVMLPADLDLCPPLSSSQKNQQGLLISAPAPKGNWRSVWTDQPSDETAVFIRTLGDVDTRIAAYDTPLDNLLIEAVKSAIGQSSQASPPMPVVEVPAAKASDTVTLFYSGDGGWRDLDRTVAGEMAAQNYPVVGVDVLRYFWEHKTPEQAAADLATTMAYYRKNWGVKSFVLAGYSFGADVLPPIYNRLSAPDQNSVSLLVLLALADHADFEIHVTGWLGQSDGEHALAPELIKLPKQKILCIYGKDEKSETACTALANSDARILELPGGHHFDQDYPKLTRQILDVYQQHGIH